MGARTCLLLGLLTLGCRNPEAESKEKGASPLVPREPVSTASSVILPEPAASAAPKPLVDPLAKYVEDAKISDLPACENFGILLVKGYPTIQSKQAWLSETLRVEPRFVTAIRDGSLGFHDVIYGTHHFATATTGAVNLFAYAVTCKDHSLCLAFAGLYSRVDLEAKSEVFCGGIPGASSGSFFSLDRTMARPRSHPHGTCGRYRACLAFAGKATESCDGLDVSAIECAKIESCEDALECFSKEPRNPARKLWADRILPRRGSF